MPFGLCFDNPYENVLQERCFGSYIETTYKDGKQCIRNSDRTLIREKMLTTEELEKLKQSMIDSISRIDQLKNLQTVVE